jgi:hypothetical protein
VQGFTARAFRGCGVVTSDPFEVSDGARRTAELSLFCPSDACLPVFPIDSPNRITLLFTDTEAVQMLQRFSQVGEHYIMSVTDLNVATPAFAGSGDILIYDEERDVQVKISLKDAAKATGLFEEDGNTLKYKASVDQTKIKLSDGKGGIVDAAGYLDELKKALKGEASTAAICLARPFIEHAMLSAVLTVSGQDTGATIFGPSDMQVGAAFLIDMG